MRHQAIKVRIYPANEQKKVLDQHFGCSRWWWNFALNLCIETYQKTGKGLTRSALNAYLPKLKKMKGTEWLSECYSQVLQSTTLNLTTAFKNFSLGARSHGRETRPGSHRFEGRARYPRFKSKKNKQSIQFPQKVTVIEDCIKFPGKLGRVLANAGWGIFVNFLSYKLEREGKVLVEIDRWFPSSKTCSNCPSQISELPLDLREWDCPSSGTHHDRDENAAKNIRSEGIRMLSVSGTGTVAVAEDVRRSLRSSRSLHPRERRPKRGRKSWLRQSPLKTEAQTFYS